MLDSNILTQLQSVFAPLDQQVTLTYSDSGHDKQAELVTLLEQLVSTSPKLAVKAGAAKSAQPSFSVDVGSVPTGISFRGVPGGHEFSSVVLAILNSAGRGKMPDDFMTARIQKLTGPIRLTTYVSLSCENCPDVVQALNLMASLHSDFEHEMVDGALAQDEVSSLGIQGVPSVIHNGKLLMSGKTNLGELLDKLEEVFGTTHKVEAQNRGTYDVAVIGGGPAGVSAAIYAARKGLKTVVIADRVGGQLQDTKGIENLISVPYTEGPELSASLVKHMKEYQIEVWEQRRVLAIDAGAPRTIRLHTGEELLARATIIATGAQWRKLGVPGENDYIGRGVAFCPHCDGPYYKGKDIAVVGGGNSGVEAALDLANIVKSVVLIEFGTQLRADQVLIDKLKARDNVTIITNARTTKIDGDGRKVTELVYQDRASEQDFTLPLDGVFVQIGLSPNSGFVKDVVAMNDYGEIKVDNKGRTDQPGIFAAGDVTTVPYKQIVVSMGEGAKAALAAFESLS